MKLKNFAFFVFGFLLASLFFLSNKIRNQNSYTEKTTAVTTFIQMTSIQSALKLYLESCSFYPTTENFADIYSNTPNCKTYKKPENMSSQVLTDKLGRSLTYQSDGYNYTLKSSALSWIEGSNTSPVKIIEIDKN